MTRLLSFLLALVAAAGVARAEWVPVQGGQLPQGAFVGGEEHGRPLYLCRARYGEGWHTGKVVGANCNFGYGGQEMTTPSYEVLFTDRPAQWVFANAGSIPADAFVGGMERGERRFVCRARYMDGVHPGKVVNGSCNFGYGGREMVVGSYEVLVLGPMAPPPPPPVVYAPPQWVPAAGGSVPANAFAAGEESGHPLFLCRAMTPEGTRLGKVVVNACNVAVRGSEQRFPQYEVLTNVMNASWAGAVGGQHPQGAFIGATAPGREFAVCRTRYENGVNPGWLALDACIIGWGGREIRAPEYQVLMVAPPPVVAIAPVPPAPMPATYVPAPPQAPPPVYPGDARPVQPQNPYGAATPVQPVNPYGATPVQPVMAPAPHWVRASGAVPPDAFVAGNWRDRPVYLCRARLEHGMRPGHVREGRCVVGFNGSELPVDDFEVLLGATDERWVPSRDGQPVMGAFVGGWAEGQQLVVCRANYDEAMRPGTVVGNSCHFGWHGQEMQIPQYEVLVGTAAMR